MLPDRLKTLRLEAKLTQKQISKKLGIPQNSYSQYENGKRNIPWGMEEKFGQGSSDLLAHIIKDAPNIAKGEGYFTEGRVQNILEKIKDVADVAKYFSNKLNPDDSNAVGKQLIAAEQELSPDKSTREIYQELDQHRKD